jgi:methoxymalonate biosynthesis acyl carrier protein
MTSDHIASPLRQFMARSFDGRVIADHDDIFALGFANSLFAMQLVAFVERQYGVEIGSDDLEMDNFRSIQAISDLVGRKLTSASA